MRLWVLIFCVLLGQIAFGQRYSFFQRGVEDGLPNAAINDIEEDETGMIWLATDGGGLLRFDGVNFRSADVFKNLPSLFVTIIAKDAKGNFWIGTEKGLAFYDGKSLTVFEEGPRSRINAISFVEDVVWLATQEGLFSLQNGKIKADKSTAKKEILSLATWAGALYYSTVDGTFVREITGEQQLRFKGISKIVALKNGLVLCGEDSVFVQINNLHFAYAIPEVRDVVLTDKGVFWFASQRNGLVKVQQQKTETIDAKHGLAYFRVRSLLYKNGKMWIGSQQGLSFFQNPNSFVFDASQGIADESVHAAIKVKTNYWLGTASGISKISTDGTVQNFNASHGLPSGIVLDLVWYNGTIWAATEQGVAFLKGDRFYLVKEASDFTFCLKSSETELLIGTATGANVFSNGRVRPIPFENDFPDGIVSIESTELGDLFIGISGMVYKKENAMLSQIKEWHGLAIDTLSVYAIKAGNGVECLLENGSGLYIWNGVELLSLDETQGLHSTLFKSAVFAGDRLWLTTDLGMQHIQLTSNPNRPFIIETITNFASINQRSFTNRTMRVTSENLLLSGSANGLFVLNNASVGVRNKVEAKITEVKLFFKSETPWSEFTNKLSPWLNLPENLELPYDENYVSFKFNVAPFDAQDGDVFMRFKLLGQDKKWTNADERREAFFTNIRPGDYVFMVESSLSPQFTEAQRATFSFKIIPPFWRTWWFISLVVLVVVGLVVFVTQYRIRQLNHKLELENALAESERKALRLQMNPHFVFNALDAISGFIFQNNAKEAVRYLGSFAKLMRITLESSRETLVPLHNEIQLLKNYIDLEQLRFNNKFQYIIKIDDEVDVYESHLPPMLLQPFVENAILHGLRNKEGEDGLLEISFKDVDDHLVCAIKDNGIGREKSAELNKVRTKKSLATSITEERIELLSLSLGERVTFSIVDLKNTLGEAAGTEVIITFPHLVADE